MNILIAMQKDKIYYFIMHSAIMLRGDLRLLLIYLTVYCIAALLT